MLDGKTCVIYLIGLPGVGKYTIAKELAKHGYVVCDNQLVNNPIFALLNYDGFKKIPNSAWDAIAAIRNSVFNFISNETESNYVFTNVLEENEGDHKLFKQVEQIAAKRNSLFIPIKLSISEEEHIKRIQQPERLLRFKSIKPEDVYAKEGLIKFTHPNLLDLDVTKLSAQDAANKILDHLESLR